jgi:GntR family transcriptional regulator/MocR family aminotransferase
VPAAGIHLVAHLRQGMREEAVISRARAASIALYGISGFYAGRRSQQGLLFGYGDTPVQDIHASMEQLAALLASA